MPDLRQRLRSTSLPGRGALSLQNGFRLASMLLFFAVMIALILVSVTADIILVAILASVLVAQMLHVLLPMERIRAKARTLYTGEAGEDVYDELDDRGGRLK